MMNLEITRLRDMFAARHEPENMKPMAEVLWRTLLISACVFACVFFFHGLWVFWGVIENLNSSYTTAQSSPSPTINRMKLQEVLSAYETRESDFEAIRINAPSVSDPSR